MPRDCLPFPEGDTCSNLRRGNGNKLGSHDAVHANAKLGITGHFLFLVNFHDNLDFGPIDENIIDLSNRNTGKADFVADFETIDIVKDDIELILPGRQN